ncbi:DUF6284 family protein [Streptomyces sp. BI20]|uniref:DUF6284 family protein n=1 Tax=Streptomyces sp. BI20 TaxID=3403460 RepID=UPI003C76D691
MKMIDVVLDPVTGEVYGPEPTDADLAAIDAEQSVPLADVDLLDVRIALADRPTLTLLDARRVRRAHRRVLAARRAAANAVLGGAA